MTVHPLYFLINTYKDLVGGIIVAGLIAGGIYVTNKYGITFKGIIIIIIIIK